MSALEGAWSRDILRCELLEVPGADNVRDIGGYLGLDGRPVQKRRFIRAGAVHALTIAGVEAVRRLGTDCVVDLRSGYERQRHPDVLEKDGDIGYIHIPLLDSIQSNVAEGGVIFPESMEAMYISLLDQDQSAFLRLMQVFADPALHTILYHCTAGKDRTGLATMLLLGAAGVSHADIVEDYAHSQHLLPQEAIHPQLPSYLFESKPSSMEAVLAHLDKTYGGILPYLRTIGLDGDLLRNLRQKLLSDE